MSEGIVVLQEQNIKERLGDLHSEGAAEEYWMGWTNGHNFVLYLSTNTEEREENHLSWFTQTVCPAKLAWGH